MEVKYSSVKFQLIVQRGICCGQTAPGKMLMRGECKATNQGKEIVTITKLRG